MRLRPSQTPGGGQRAASSGADERLAGDGAVDDRGVNDRVIDDRDVDDTAADGTPADNTAVDNTAVDNTDAPERSTLVPTFTPAARRAPDDEASGGDEVSGTAANDVAAERDETPAGRDGTGYRGGIVYADDTAYRDGVTAGPRDNVADEPATVAERNETPADLDQPLLSGGTELLTQWQRVQAEFVDDPQLAVAGAADLVEQAGRALVDALERRQRQMRTLWQHDGADGSAAPGEPVADTEQLRQLMHRYRALFNQLCQPV